MESGPDSAQHEPDGARPAGTRARAARGQAKLLVRLSRFVILYVLLRPVVLLPFGFQLAVGRALGRVAFRFAREPRRIVHCNLRACFPELSAAELEDLNGDTSSSGWAQMRAFAWWASEAAERAVGCRGWSTTRRRARKGATYSS
jgi:lauroyl/myristoyl acyltransferase